MWINRALPTSATSNEEEEGGEDCLEFSHCQLFFCNFLYFLIYIMMMPTFATSNEEEEEEEEDYLDFSHEGKY